MLLRLLLKFSLQNIRVVLKVVSSKTDASTSSSAVSNCVVVLRNACKHDRSRLEVANAGGIEALVRLCAHEEKRIVTNSQLTLLTIAYDEATTKQFVQFGGVSIISAMVSTDDAKMQVSMSLDAPQLLAYSRDTPP